MEVLYYMPHKVYNSRRVSSCLEKKRKWLFFLSFWISVAALEQLLYY